MHGCATLSSTVACMISGALIPRPGAAAMYLICRPSSAFNLSYFGFGAGDGADRRTAHWIARCSAPSCSLDAAAPRVTISSEVTCWCSALCWSVVVVAPKGIIGLLRPRYRLRREASHDVTAAPDAPLLQVGNPAKSLAASPRSTISASISRERRAVRPDSERLRQDDADQLHFRRAATSAAGSVVFCGEDITQLPPHLRARRASPGLSDSAAVQEHDGAGKPHGRARLCFGRLRLRRKTSRCRS